MAITNMQVFVDNARELVFEKLGQQMVSDLFKIAQLTQQPIPEMRLNANGVFEEVKKPVFNQDQNIF